MTTFSTQSNIFDVFQIPEIPDRNYWFIRSQGGAYYEDFLINKYIAIAWNDISHDYVMTHSEEQIKSKIDVLLLREESNDDDIKSEKSQKTKVTMAYNKLIRFSKEIKRGDIILLPSSNSDKIAIGIVASDVYVNDHYIVDYLSENPTTEINLCPFHKRRNVNWVQGFDRRKMDIYLQKAFASQHALSNMNNYATYIDRAIYPLYVRNNQTHATFHAVHPEGMTLRNLADLIYTMEKSIYDVAEQCEMPIEDEDIEVKLNIHSPGLVEIIGITMAAGFAISIVVNALNHYKNGGKISNYF